MAIITEIPVITTNQSYTYNSINNCRWGVEWVWRGGWLRCVAADLVVAAPEVMSRPHAISSSYFCFCLWFCSCILFWTSPSLFLLSLMPFFLLVLTPSFRTLPLFLLLPILYPKFWVQLYYWCWHTFHPAMHSKRSVLFLQSRYRGHDLNLLSWDQVCTVHVKCLDSCVHGITLRQPVRF